MMTLDDTSFLLYTYGILFSLTRNKEIKCHQVSSVIKNHPLLMERRQLPRENDGRAEFRVTLKAEKRH